MMERGVLYVAYGDLAREACARSIATVREFMPQLPVAVVSDAPLDGATLLAYPDADAGARTYKTQMYTLSPFVETLYLDADTECVTSPRAGFGLLKWMDVVLAQDDNHRLADCRWRAHDPHERAATLVEVGLGGDVKYYNSGVVFFRRSARAEALFTAWHQEWLRWGKHDQLALARALARCPVRLAAMRAPWNTRKRERAAFVWHNHHSVGREGAPG